MFIRFFILLFHGLATSRLVWSINTGGQSRVGKTQGGIIRAKSISQITVTVKNNEVIKDSSLKPTIIYYLKQETVKSLYSVARPYP